jgi:hypothetical protein
MCALGVGRDTSSAALSGQPTIPHAVVGWYFIAGGLAQTAGDQ